MTSKRRNGLLLAAVIAALPVFGLTRPAAAQYPAGQDGHANDANNRAGSGGYNSARQGSAVTQDNIINRTVSGGIGFTGPIRETDPGAFRVRLPGTGLDNFIRTSNGVPTGTGGTSDLTVPHPYYGDSRGVAPPPGSLPVGFSGGYVGTTPQNNLTLSSSLSTPSTGATTLQARTIPTDTLLLNSVYNTSGYQGITDAALNGNLASPLPGLRPGQPGDLATSPFALPALPQLPGGLPTEDPAVLRMRAELQEAALPSSLNPNVGENNNGQPGGPNFPGSPQNQNGTQQNPNGTQQNPNGGQNQNGGQPNQPGGQQNQPGAPNQPLNGVLPAPLETPANAAISNQPNGSQLNATPLNNTPAGQESLRQRMTTLVPAAQQSTLLTELQNRMARYGPAGTSDAEANRKFREMQQKNARPGKPGAGVGLPQQAPPDTAPVKVSSLATGVKAKGLHDLLAGAEDLMRQGKFDSAIDKYAQAQRVAPNNPLTYLGRAHAELGAGYYAKAEQDLRYVFRADPELLLAQFDLGTAMGEQRLAFLRKDLTGLTQSEPKSETPWFLLAYLDYNGGDAAAAEKDLNEAEQRAGHGDWAIRTLRTHWTLPSNRKPAAPGEVPTAPRSAPPATQTPGAPATPAPARDLNK
jgi:hypothetical protein